MSEEPRIRILTIEVHAGKKRIPPEVAAHLAEHMGEEALTARELEVLRHRSPEPIDWSRLVSPSSLGRKWSVTKNPSRGDPSMSDAIKVAFALLVLLVAHPCLAADISESSLRAADAEQMRIIVEGDAKSQDAFMHQNYILNGPSNRVRRKSVLVDMLAQGKMASERFERTIEGTAITGNIGIVMGSEIVQPRAGSELGEKFGNAPLKRRFTNVYIFEEGRWRFLARQASVIETPCK